MAANAYDDAIHIVPDFPDASGRGPPLAKTRPHDTDAFHHTALGVAHLQMAREVDSELDDITGLNVGQVCLGILTDLKQQIHRRIRKGEESRWSLKGSEKYVERAKAKCSTVVDLQLRWTEKIIMFDNPTSQTRTWSVTEAEQPVRPALKVNHGSVRLCHVSMHCLVQKKKRSLGALRG